MVVLGNAPLTPMEAALPGYVSTSTYVQRIMDMTAAYKGNAKWYEAYGLTEPLLRIIIPKYAYYSDNGKSIYVNAGNIVADIKKETGVLLNTQKLANAIGTMDMALVSFARKNPKDALVTWWRTGHGTVAAAATKAATTVKTSAAKALTTTVNALQDVRETVGDATDKILPWYLRPKTLVIGGAVVGVVWLLLPRLSQAGVAAYKEARRP